MSEPTVEEVIANIKAQMNARGASTIRGLGRIFNTSGDEGNRRISGQEFYVGINECGVTLSKP